MSDARCMEFDVVVVGSGAAGLTAAITAEKMGLKVLVIESTEYFGGTTALSAGGAWIPCNSVMKQAGFADDRKSAETYLRAVLGSYFEADKIDRFLVGAPEMVDFLSENSLVKFQSFPIPDYEPSCDGWRYARCILPVDFDGRQLGGLLPQLRRPLRQMVLFGSLQITPSQMGDLKSAHRSIGALARSFALVTRFVIQSIRYGRGTHLANGNALVGRMLASLKAGTSTLWNRSAARELIVANGRVAGVIVDREGQRISVTATRGVILATGGFGRDPKMHAQYVPGMDPEWTLQPEGNVGDGIRLGQQNGGHLVKGNAYNANFVPMSLHRNRVGKEIRYPHLVLDRHCPGVIAVAAAGKRFVNEAFHYQHFVETMIGCGLDKAWLICNRDTQRKYGLGLAKPAPFPIDRWIKDGYIVANDTIEGLATAVGIDPSNLTATVRQYDEGAAHGKDPEFHRGEDIYSAFMGDPSVKPNSTVGPIGEGPYYALEIRPGDLTILCGLETDKNSRVLDGRGVPIQGLFAIGLDANNLFRGKYPGGGASIGPSMTFAYLVAKLLATNQAEIRLPIAS
jgi:succinate dehydrogenase/fumarate reductase flavoprotein subunit